ncbi:MAG: AAA family ATPase [Armatimonadota bacterium]
MPQDDDLGRERIVSGHQRVEDSEESVALRPRSLAEYDVGQERLIENLKITIGAARQRGDVLEHLLFDGPPGLGKTTLAHIIANEMEADLHRTSGPSLERASDLVGLLTNLKRGISSSSTKSTASRMWLRSFCTRRWRTSASTSSWTRAPTPRRFR